MDILHFGAEGVPYIELCVKALITPYIELCERILPLYALPKNIVINYCHNKHQHKLVRWNCCNVHSMLLCMHWRVKDISKCANQKNIFNRLKLLVIVFWKLKQHQWMLLNAHKPWQITSVFCKQENWRLWFN